MKNIEKIRQMTIDELAKWLNSAALDSICNICVGCDSEEEIGCIKGTIQWLELEVEE